MKKALPTVSSASWVTDPKDKLSRLFANTFVANHSQSNIYQGNITSVQYIAVTHGKDPVRFAAALETALTGNFQRYYDEVQVRVTPPAGDVSGRYTVLIECKVTENGIEYDHAQTLQHDPSQGTVKLLEAIT